MASYSVSEIATLIGKSPAETQLLMRQSGVDVSDFKAVFDFITAQGPAPAPAPPNVDLAVSCPDDGIRNGVLAVVKSALEDRGFTVSASGLLPQVAAQVDAVDPSAYDGAGSAVGLLAP